MMPGYNQLPLGISSFHSLRVNRQVYVDKTDLIFRLAAPCKRAFIARPRRFGKSLLVSTLASLFQFGLRDFQGLKIEKVWRDRIYDVVSLDFSRIKNFSSADEFRLKLYDYLTARFATVGFRFNPDGRDLLNQLEQYLNSREASSLVLLIDEYDAPLTRCLTDPALLEGIKPVICDFFAFVKANDEAFRFFFMTGITKISQTGIFSDFNNLDDITLNREFGALLGYTEAELKARRTHGIFCRPLSQDSLITADL